MCSLINTENTYNPERRDALLHSPMKKETDPAQKPAERLVEWGKPFRQKLTLQPNKILWLLMSISSVFEPSSILGSGAVK